MLGTVDNMPSPTGHPLLLGRFYPEYDIAVSLIWLFIILAGVGNWVVIWCILRTKSLRNPFNMIVIALGFSNGVATTIVGPMELIRILMSYSPVSTHWCNTRVLLKTFSFSISILIIFTLSAMRLTAGLLKTHQKLTYKKIAATIITIYSVAILTSPVMLDKTSSTYRVCLGNVHYETLRLILENEGLTFSDVTMETQYNSSENEVSNATDFLVDSSPSATTGLDHHSLLTRTTTVATTATTSETWNASSLVDVNENLVGQSSPMRLWVYYLIVTIALFIGTIICYIGLIIILKRHTHVMNGMVLGNSKDILTMRVTAYVTCMFLVSFLIPFFPALITLPPQATRANLHYISIFHCLSALDGALTPLIYQFSNVGYQKALLKALPCWMRRVFCRSTQVAPILPSNNQDSNSTTAAAVAPLPAQAIPSTSAIQSASHRLSPNAAYGIPE